MTARHPLLNKHVKVTFTDGKHKNLYVAYVDDKLGFIRFTDNNTWAEATWIGWLAVDEIVKMDEIA